MDKAKVVTLSKFRGGGAGIAAYRLHEALNKVGFKSTFLTSHRAGDQDAENLVYVSNKSKLQRILKKLIRSSSTKSDYIEKKIKLNNYKTQCEIKSLPYSDYKLEQEKQVKDASIVHLHWVSEFVNYESFFKDVKQPVVWTLHDMNPFQGVFHYKDDEIRNKQVIGSFDESIRNKKQHYIHAKENIHIVCLSKWLMEASQQSEIFGRYPHYLIPNGLSESNFNRIDDIEERKVAIGLNPESKTFLFVAQDLDNPRKGFDLLYSALEKIKDKHINIITVGSNKPELFEKFTHVHFSNLKQGEEINEKYQMADMTLLTSREDNLPNVMLESFFNGTPVMAFNTGGMKEHIKDGENGVLIDCFDTNKLSEAMMRVINNEHSYSSEIIKNYALKYFDVNLQTEKYKELYNKILNEQ